jgi:hypothetical protein
MTLCWKERSLVGDLPPSRGGHTLSAVCGSSSGYDGIPLLVLVGGSDAFGIVSNEVFVVRPLAGAITPWRSLKATMPNCSSENAMPARMGHSAITIKAEDAPLDALKSDNDATQLFAESVLVFGGSVSVPEPKLFNDLWVLHLRRGTPVRRAGVKERDEVVEAHWKCLTGVTGTLPAPRHAHGVCSLSSGPGPRMLVVGGAGAAGLLSDAYVLELSGLVWTCIATHPLLRREMLSAVALPGPNGTDVEVVVTGGRGIDGELVQSTIALHPAVTSGCHEKATYSIRELDTDPLRGSGARCCHSLLVLSPAVLLAVGGLVGDNDLYHDTLVALDGGVSAGVAVRRVDTRGTEFMLGFGQSAATWTGSCNSTRRHCVCSGIFPNAVSHSNCLYELVLN